MFRSTPTSRRSTAAIVEPLFDLWNRLNDRTSVRGDPRDRRRRPAHAAARQWRVELLHADAAEARRRRSAGIGARFARRQSDHARQIGSSRTWPISLSRSRRRTARLPRRPFSLYEGIVEQTKREELAVPRCIWACTRAPLGRRVGDGAGALVLARDAGVDQRADRRGAARGGRDPAEGRAARRAARPGRARAPAADGGAIRTTQRRAAGRVRPDNPDNPGRPGPGDRGVAARGLRFGSAVARSLRAARERVPRRDRGRRAREDRAASSSATLQSGDALERFYAVNAMARVDAAYFRDALRSAARDADRHVSDLARRALEKLSRVMLTGVARAR